MFDALARWVTRRPKQVVVLFFLLAAVSIPFGLGVHKDLSAAGLEAPSSESSRVRDELREHFGISAPEILAAFGTPAQPLPPERRAAVLDPIVAALRADPSVVRVTTPTEPDGSSLKSTDAIHAMLLIDLADDAGDDALDRLTPILERAGVPVLLGGEIPAEAEARDLAMSDLQRAEAIALPIAGLLLLVFFRGPWAAMLPLVVGALAVPATLSVLRGLAQVANISVFALSFTTFLGTGLSIDYALVLVQRFRDERGEGHTVDEAVLRTLRTSGRAVLISGIAVVGSLAALLVFPMVLLRSVAVAGVVVVITTLLAALVLLPALLVLLGDRVGKSAPARLHGTGGWGRLASFVLRRRTIVAIAAIAILLPVAAPMLHLKTITPDASSFPEEVDARKVDDLLRKGVFGTDLRNPLLVVAHTTAPVASADGALQIVELVKRIQATPGVARVDSPFAAPQLADAGLVRQLFSMPPEQRPPQLNQVLEQTASGNLALLRVIGTADRHDHEAEVLVERLRKLSTPDLHVEVGGETALAFDAKQSLVSHAGWAAGLVVLVNLVVLFFAFGSVVIPITAVLANVISIGASFGALVWIFQDGHLSKLLRFESPGGLDLTVPVVLFAVVFGLSMDYEVFLIARIREAYDLSGDSHESVVVGLERTGSIITRAAALLVVVVVGFALGRFLFVQELGAGMAIAIAIDATIVRGLLVPATISMLGDATWWAPPPLRRFWSRFGMQFSESA